MHLADLAPLTADPAFVIGVDRRLVSVNGAAAALVAWTVLPLLAAIRALGSRDA